MSHTDYSQIFLSRDMSQDRRIRELQENLDVAYSQMARDRSRVRSELSRVRGTLEQRLDRVSATLDAFIELSDVRATLAMFDNAAIARHRTLQMLNGTALPSLELEDVPGYWLVPAARGLHSLLGDDLPRARLHFDEAARVDPLRARGFAALTGALTRAEHARTLGENVSADLLPRLPDPDSEVTRCERALWILTADGSFGDDAREHLLLSTLRGWPGDGVRSPLVDGWFGSGTPANGRGGRPRGPRDSGALPLSTTAAPWRQAASDLAHLRERISGITDVRGEGATSETLGPDRASSDFLQDSLRLLVEEGSPEEAPLLADANRLRAVIENSGQDGTLPAWSDDVGTVASLLQQDLTREDAPPQRRTFSLVLVRSAVLDAAEALANRANEPCPETAILRVHGAAIQLTPSGANRQQVEDTRERLRQRAVPEGGPRRSFWGASAVTGVLLLLSVLTANGLLWVLTLAGAASAGYALFLSEREKADAEGVVRHQSRQLDQQVDTAVREWRRTRSETEEHAVAARHDLEAIRSLLAS
ncbi:hypothetical protein [Nocardiopsis sp. L17-MgMaSL7]|uniref:hypothetical protein n=1 Tax=Nocardiopsis sp. L17-MgMaSL7 TaxID=1938893 RepID=UPI000D70C09C|nr:hypothetical protein [Nocardiopsis sp. L17-MgMaSL7]PWV55444.1 hypothetical protein BDW27_103448 [Nocardiopsis sp. L17-MgMaSL7]